MWHENHLPIVHPDTKRFPLRVIIGRRNRTSLENCRALLICRKLDRVGAKRWTDGQEPLIGASDDTKTHPAIQHDGFRRLLHEFSRIWQTHTTQLEVLIGSTETPVRARKRQERVKLEVLDAFFYEEIKKLRDFRQGVTSNHH